MSGRQRSQRQRNVPPWLLENARDLIVQIIGILIAFWLAARWDLLKLRQERQANLQATANGVPLNARRGSAYTRGVAMKALPLLLCIGLIATKGEIT